MDLLCSFVGGWVGGIGNLLVGHPFDTIKTLLQDDKSKHKNAISCLVNVVRERGPLVLYKGVLAPMSGVGVIFAIYFLVYDATEKLIRFLKAMDPNKPLPMVDVMLCGGSTGVVGSIFFGPAELLKVRQQTALNSGADSTLRGAVSYIYRKEGVRGFFRGTGATMLRDGPGSVAWFGAYEYAKLCLCRDPKRPTASEAMLAGGFGGLGMWSFALPLDAIKTRVQASREGIGVTGAVGAIFKERGLRGFYRGLGPVMLRAFPANAACFSLKEITMSTLKGLSDRSC